MWNAIFGVASAAVMAFALFVTHAAGERSGRAQAEVEIAKSQASEAEQRVARLETAARQMQQAGEAFEAKATNIRTTYRLIEKEIPRVIPAEVDRAFPLPAGLVRLHDAAALGRPLGLPPASEPDGAASPVAASAFGGVVAVNYEACRVDQERLAELQALIRAQPGY